MKIDIQKPKKEDFEGCYWRLEGEVVAETEDGKRKDHGRTIRRN